MKFAIGDKVQLLNNKITETGTEVLKGNRGIVSATFKDVASGVETLEIFFPVANYIITVSPEDIDFYISAHLSSIFTIQQD